MENIYNLNIQKPKKNYPNLWQQLILDKPSKITESVRKEIANNPTNWELWYLLFLSENNNYIGFNKDNINNIDALNTARGFAEDNEIAFINMEYELYSNACNIRGLDLILRKYQFGAFDELIQNLVIFVDNNKIDIDCHNILKPLNELFNISNDLLEINLQIIILNALYIKLGYQELLEIFNEKINSEIYSESKLEIKSICNNEKELESYMVYNKIYSKDTNEFEILKETKSTYNPHKKEVVKRPAPHVLTAEEREQQIRDEAEAETYKYISMYIGVRIVILLIVIFIIIIYGAVRFLLY